MQKLSIPQVVGIITLIGILSTFILKYGSLPQAMAQVQEKVNKYQEDISDLKAEQRYIKEKTDDIHDLLKHLVKNV